MSTVAAQLRVPSPGRVERLVTSFAGGGVGWSRPTTGLWCPYADVLQRGCPHTELTDRLLVLRRVGGAPLTLHQTLAVTNALRGTLLPHLTGFRWGSALLLKEVP